MHISSRHLMQSWQLPSSVLMKVIHFVASPVKNIKIMVTMVCTNAVMLILISILICRYSLDKYLNPNSQYVLSYPVKTHNTMMKPSNIETQCYMVAHIFVHLRFLGKLQGFSSTPSWIFVRIFISIKNAIKGVPKMYGCWGQNSHLTTGLYLYPS